MFTIPYLLDRAAKLFLETEVVGTEVRRGYREISGRIKSLAAYFEDLGVKNRVVAVADWSTSEFFELIYAITTAGGVVYPVNIRLPPEQIAYTLQKSESQILIYSDDFAALTKVFDGEKMHIREVAERREARGESQASRQDRMIQQSYSSQAVLQDCRRR